MAKKYWIKKKSRLMTENPWFEVYKDDVIRPDGKDGEYNYLRFKSPGVSVIPVDDEGNLYLTREYLYPFQEYLIQSACGGINENEEPVEAAKRELKEETGIEASEYISLGKYYTLTTFGKIQTNLFIAKGLKVGKPELEGSELIELYKVNLKEAVKLVMENKIQDMTPAYHILRVRDYLASEESK